MRDLFRRTSKQKNLYESLNILKDARYFRMGRYSRGEKMVSIEDIHVGDRVRIREWDDMAAEYIVKAEDKIIVPPSGICFVLDMKKYCGKEATIAKIITSLTGKYARIWFENYDCDWDRWTFTNEMIELIDDTPPYEITDEEFFGLLKAH